MTPSKKTAGGQMQRIYKEKRKGLDSSFRWNDKRFDILLHKLRILVTKMIGVW